MFRSSVLLFLALSTQAGASDGSVRRPSSDVTPQVARAAPTCYLATDTIDAAEFYRCREVFIRKAAEIELGFHQCEAGVDLTVTGGRICSNAPGELPYGGKACVEYSGEMVTRTTYPSTATRNWALGLVIERIDTCFYPEDAAEATKAKAENKKQEDAVREESLRQSKG